MPATARSEEGAALAALPSTQRIAFCRGADGARLAYARHGAGPVLVEVANWLSHLEAFVRRVAAPPAAI